ncbi:MAG: lipopolysaccharide biosynthesis protein [Paraglaciecola sp.]|jgi:lipopolysaccharide biosynthesis protein
MKRARAIAFYLPQYHPVEANDKFWGKGFTEWTNVTKAKPLYKGHKQPKLPSDLGLYDLRVPEVREQQVQLAKDAGIEAFCYWHYWFGKGERVLERIFEEVVKNKKPDFPFCLGWANESWTGRWHGLDNEIIFEQTYPGEQDYIDHFNSILPALKDERYLTVNDQPVFLVYRPDNLPDKKQFIDLWNDLAEQNNLKKFYFIAVSDNFEENRLFDKVLRGSLTIGIPRKKQTLFKKMNSNCPSDIFNYKDIVNIRLKTGYQENEIPLVIPNWDNTPRSGKNGRIFDESTPELYYQWLKESIDHIKDRPIQERIVFIKSWNEWAEGNYLEPDRGYGSTYLESTKKAIYSK